MHIATEHMLYIYNYEIIERRDYCWAKHNFHERIRSTLAISLHGPTCVHTCTHTHALLPSLMHMCQCIWHTSMTTVNTTNIQALHACRLMKHCYATLLTLYLSTSSTLFRHSVIDCYVHNITCSTGQPAQLLTTMAIILYQVQPSDHLTNCSYCYCWYSAARLQIKPGSIGHRYNHIIKLLAKPDD